MLFVFVCLWLTKTTNDEKRSKMEMKMKIGGRTLDFSIKYNEFV